MPNEVKKLIQLKFLESFPVENFIYDNNDGEIDHVFMNTMLLLIVNPDGIKFYTSHNCMSACSFKI